MIPLLDDMINKFLWEDYLSETNTIAAPADIFIPVIFSCFFLVIFCFLVTLPVPFISESCMKIINLNFYSHTSFWCLRSFYEGIQGLHKTFWGTTKKCENNFLSLSEIGTEKVNVYSTNHRMQCLRTLIGSTNFEVFKINRNG